MKLSHLFAFLGGAVVGAAVGILFAPEKGSTTRQNIVDLLREKGIILSKEELEAFIAKVKSKLPFGFSSEDVEDAVEDVIDEAKLA